MNKIRMKKKGFRAFVVLPIMVFCAMLAMTVVGCSIGIWEPKDQIDDKNVNGASASPEMYTSSPEPIATHAEGEMQVYFVDVGQGDCALLVSPNDMTMLIDVGENEKYTKVAILLESLEIEKIDVVVATHPHSDHIGGMAQLIDDFDIGAVYMPDVTNDTQSYENMMDALDRKGIEPEYVFAGEDTFIDWDDEVEVRTLSPIRGGEYDGLNDYSIMMKVSFEGTSLLFTGDCEKYAEAYALASLPNELFDADILKVGHHGSASSSTEEFLRTVTPELAIISVGWENQYGHPHSQTLKLLSKMRVTVMRTDQDGTIHISIDESGYRVAE